MNKEGVNMFLLLSECFTQSNWETICLLCVQQNKRSSTSMSWTWWPHICWLVTACLAWPGTHVTAGARARTPEVLRQWQPSNQHQSTTRVQLPHSVSFAKVLVQSKLYKKLPSKLTFLNG